MTANVRIGPWTCIELIGQGGNGDVWKAICSSSPDPVALKVLHRAKANEEAYLRFVREIDFLKSIPEEPGVLPLLADYLPTTPTRNDRPWLAMPIATRIDDALVGETLETVVAAVAEIAATLSRLAAQGVGHRDIKPGNLYRLDSNWLVGDFGLVAVPDWTEITQAARPVGPRHFTAYEMIVDPQHADPLPADVYSLAKTLWVLATGQRWPPEGHQPASTRGYSIRELRPHAHADALDRLVDRATRLHAAERPTMAEVARELSNWRNLGPVPGRLDVSAIGAQFRAKMERELAAEDLLEQRKQLAQDTARRLQQLIGPLNDALRSVHSGASIGMQPDKYGNSVLRTTRHSGAPDVVFFYGRISRISAGSPVIPLELTMGVGLELTADGNLLFRAYVDVAYRAVMNTVFNWVGAQQSAPVGSIDADLSLQRGVDELAKQLHLALGAFVDEVQPSPRQ